MSAPRISIVTVCLNQAETIGTAIESVLSQPGEPAEYIIIDGGSTDGTADIIQSHADRLAYSISEPDRGQSHALNKGFARATGDILGWLNADDALMPGALAAVRKAFAADDIDVLCGACRYAYADGRVRDMTVTQRELALLNVYDPIHQPSCFWRRGLHERVGGLDESLHYGMDWDLWLKFARAGARFGIVDDVLSIYGISGDNKTSVGGERRNRELYHLLQRYGAPRARALTEIAYRVLWPLKRFRRHRPEWLCRSTSNVLRTTLWGLLGPVFGFDRVRRSTHPFS